MLKLKNLRKTESIIEADFYPEDSKKAGHIVVSLKSEEIIDHTDPQGYENDFSYAAHARQNLVKLAKQDSLPDEWTVMWY